MEVPPQSPFVDTIITALTFLVPFILAAVFLHGWLFRDYETKRQWVQYLFAATFALSVNLLLLALYEILGVLEPATRWLTWRLVLVVLALDLVSRQPLTPSTHGMFATLHYFVRCPWFGKGKTDAFGLRVLCTLRHVARLRSSSCRSHSCSSSRRTAA